MTLLLSDEDVQLATDPRSLVDAIDSALRSEAAGETVAPARVNLEKDGSWLRLMPAILPARDVMGTKVFHGARSGQVRYLISLYSMTDGEPLALIDACYLTAARTAATSALATRHLINPGPVRLGVIGSGLEARTHCAALIATSDVAEVAVFSPNEQRRTALAEEIQARFAVRASACDSAQAVAEAADHVVVATNTGPAQTIAFRGQWFRPAQHITAIGSTNLQLRELDTDAFRRADRIVFDASYEQLAEESADLVAFRHEGGDASHAATLTGVVAGAEQGRTAADQITLFKSVGAALQDIAAADVIYRRARRLGLGREVPTVATSKIFQAQAREKVTD